MKRILILILVFTSLISCAQKKNKPMNHDRLYNLGLVAFENKDFLLADSLFTRALEIESNANTYFSLAIVKQILGDTCGYCENIRQASNYGNREFSKIYSSNCVTTTKKYYEENLNSHSEILTNICGETLRQNFYVKENNAVKYGFYFVDSLDNLVVKEFEVFPIIDSVLDQIVFIITDESPEYIGGEEQLLNFLAKNTDYPHDAKVNGIQGIIYTSFIVEKNGSLSNIKVLKGVHPILDNEALRVVSIMKNWTPGKYNNKAVRTVFNLPFRFQVH